ncbi:hypothetical protein F5880DRAFT_570061 [Lentinula raphanica]|nr:hypothetical protein F5880DRAFT_570061 [Lentinula raphanica]
MHSRFLLRLSLPSTTFIYLFLASLALSVVASALSTPAPQSLTQRADADAMDVDSPVYYTGIPQSMSSDSMSPESIEGIKQHTPPPSPPRTPTPTKESPAKKPSTEVQTYPVRIARYDRKNGEFILNKVDLAADQELLVVFGQIAIAPLQFGREILHASISPDNSIMLGPGRKTDIVLTQQDYERVIHNLWDREHSKILYQGMTTDLEVLDKVVQCLKTGCRHRCSRTAMIRLQLKLLVSFGSSEREKMFLIAQRCRRRKRETVRVQVREVQEEEEGEGEEEERDEVVGTNSVESYSGKIPIAQGSPESVEGRWG